MTDMKPIKRIFPVLLCCSLLVTSVAFGQAGAQVSEKGKTYHDIYEMLQNVPGLDVKTSNGKGGSIVVRGTGSLTAQGAPLFVVDGSPYDGDIRSLNPQDIESVSVLKDAASQTAYGSRGMFGVILITSKKGRNAAGGAATVQDHTESAYTYFIDHKTPLRVFGQDDNVIIEGVIQRQRNDSLIFTRKRKEFPVAISAVKRVEMVPQQ